MHIREKSRGLTCYFLFFSFFSTSASHFLSHTSFLPALGENYLRIHTPDSLLSCIIRLIPKFLSSFALVPLSNFSFPFPSYFFPPSLANLYSYSLFFFLPFPFPFSFLSSSLSPFPSLPFFFTLL